MTGDWSQRQGADLARAKSSADNPRNNSPNVFLIYLQEVDEAARNRRRGE